MHTLSSIGIEPLRYELSDGATIAPPMSGWLPVIVGDAWYGW